MGKPKGANIDSGLNCWVTVGVCFFLVWGLLSYWLSWWGLLLGWIVALPAAFALTILFWIGVDAVNKPFKDRRLMRGDL